MSKKSSKDALIELLESRLDPSAKPLHKVVSRQICFHSEPTVTLHTSGQNVLWSVPIQDLVKNDHLLSDMDPEEAKLIKWVFEHDFDVSNYHYHH